MDRFRRPVAIFAEQEKIFDRHAESGDEIIIGPARTVLLAPHLNGKIPCPGARGGLGRGTHFFPTRACNLLGVRHTHAA